MRKAIAIALLILGAGCSSSSTPPNDAASNNDTASTFTLKLENYLSWCVVTQQGVDEGTTETVTTTFPAGTVVNLHGDANGATFVWDYWVGTAGDTTSAHDTNMTTTVTMTSNKTVQACCPFATGGTALPEPCPAPS